MLVRTVTITDPQGLHAQVAHDLAAAASRFSASIWVRHDGRRASLADPIQVLALGAPAGSELIVVADGLDEAEALATICELLGTPPQ